LKDFQKNKKPEKTTQQKITTTTLQQHLHSQFH